MPWPTVMLRVPEWLPDVFEISYDFGSPETWIVCRLPAIVYVIVPVPPSTIRISDALYFSRIVDEPSGLMPLNVRSHLPDSANVFAAWLDG